VTGPPKPLHPNVQLAVQAASSVVTAIAGSWIGSHGGNRGTIRGLVIGAALGAVVSGMATRVIERAVRHVKVPARMRGRVNRRYVLLGAAAFAGAMAVSLGGLQAVEAGVFGGRSLSAEVTHSKATGTTLGTVLANHPARPSATLPAPPEASSAPATPATVTPTAGGTPGIPQTPVTMTPTASPPASVNDPSGADEPAPSATPTATTGETP